MMRSLLSRLLLALTFAAPALSAPPTELAHEADLEEDVLGTYKPSSVEADVSTASSSTSSSSDDVASGATVFNGVTVPPMKDFSGDDFDEEAKDGYW